jgi:RNA polymerase sigma-70 factor (ECF subfamily)
MASREDSDTRLLALASDGDGDAFSELVSRQRRHVCEYLRSRDPTIRPSDLEDLAQEVFARTWQFKRSYRREASAQTFLFAIAKNVLFEHWRRARRTREVDVERDVPIQPRRDSPTELRELLKIVSGALDQLTNKQRDAFLLVMINEVPVTEAALQSGTSVKAIRRRAETARQHLRRRLSACMDDCTYDCPSVRCCPAEVGGTFCLKFLIRKYL